MRERSWWGWGYTDAAVTETERDGLGAMAQALLGVELPAPRTPPALHALRLPRPRVVPGPHIARFSSDSPAERALHARGRSFVDVVANLDGHIAHPPDFVATPLAEDGITALLEWAAELSVAVTPFGGGSSVVGGVEPIAAGTHAGAVSLDLRRLNRVLEVDATSLAARIQGGVLGPDVESQLAPHGLTLRHQPQSFECSTLGGWIATRSAGHFATLQTRIDDRVESVRVITPAGVVETRRLPSSGAGPDPNRLFLGSEGTLGVISEAWVRVLPRPRHRASATVRYPDFGSGLEAVRAIAQAGLHPSNCRLLDPIEALIGRVAAGDAALLLLGFESADHPVDHALRRALELAQDHGGVPAAGAASDEQDGAASAWRDSFLRAPYIRDALITLGLVVETFESATTWDRLTSLLDAVSAAVNDAFRSLPARGVISCRITHAYPDGAAPYWTVIALGDPRAQRAQWEVVKAAVSSAIMGHGGTITHHHAVGRDHRSWYAREHPPLVADAMRAAKHTMDPAGIMNPGVLLEPGAG